jgi:hypothetical protein
MRTRKSRHGDNGDRDHCGHELARGLLEGKLIAMSLAVPGPWEGIEARLRVMSESMTK